MDFRQLIAQAYLGGLFLIVLPINNMGYTQVASISKVWTTLLTLLCKLVAESALYLVTTLTASLRPMENPTYRGTHIVIPGNLRARILALAREEHCWDLAEPLCQGVLTRHLQGCQKVLSFMPCMSTSCHTGPLRTSDTYYPTCGAVAFLRSRDHALDNDGQGN